MIFTYFKGQSVIKLRRKAPWQKVRCRKVPQSTLRQILRDTLLLPRVNYTVASPEFIQRKNKTKTCSDYWFPSRPVSLLQKFQKKHLAPKESRSDDFWNFCCCRCCFFFFFFGGGGGITWLSVGIEEGYVGGIKEIWESVYLTLENYWLSPIRRDRGSGQKFMTSLCTKKSEKEYVFKTK